MFLQNKTQLVLLGKIRIKFHLHIDNFAKQHFNVVMLFNFNFQTAKLYFTSQPMKHTMLTEYTT